MEWMIDGVLGLGLGVLSIVYWRSQQSAHANESQYKQEFKTLRQASTQTQDKLEQRLEEMTQKWQVAQQENDALRSQIERLKQQG